MSYVDFYSGDDIQEVDTLPDDIEDLSIYEQALMYPPPGWIKVFEAGKRRLEITAKNIADKGQYYPRKKYLYHIFRICPLKMVKVVIIGQDPYPDINNAWGVSFSTPPGVARTASEINIFKKLQEEYSDFVMPKDGCLRSWVDQGVFLLNYCLTYHPNKPLDDDEQKLWIPFIKLVITAICEENPNCVFILWGNKAKMFDTLGIIKKCHIITGCHPSPRNGSMFVNSETMFFQQANEILARTGQSPIDWRL